MNSKNNPLFRKVRSKFGNEVAFSQHYEDVVEYFESKRHEALKLAKPNTSLEKFIKSWGLFMVANRGSKVSVGLKKGKNKLVGYQKNIDFKIYNSYGKGSSIYDTKECQHRVSDFMNSIDLLRGALVSYYIFPKINKKNMMVEFIHYLLSEGLKWELNSVEKMGELSLIHASRTFIITNYSSISSTVTICLNEHVLGIFYSREYMCITREKR